MNFIQLTISKLRNKLYIVLKIHSDKLLCTAYWW